MIVPTRQLGSTAFAQQFAPMMTSVRINPEAATEAGGDTSSTDTGVLGWINANKTTAALIVVGGLAALFVIRRVL